jgi:hypothetical protein
LRRFLRQIDIAFIRAWEKRPGDFDEDCTHPTQAVADAKVA